MWLKLQTLTLIRFYVACLFLGSAVLVTLSWNHCEIQMTNIPQTAPVWRSLLQSHKILNELCFFPRSRKKGNNCDYTSGSANRNHGVSVKVSKRVFAWPQRWLSLGGSAGMLCHMTSLFPVRSLLDSAVHFKSAPNFAPCVQNYIADKQQHNNTQTQPHSKPIQGLLVFVCLCFCLHSDTQAQKKIRLHELYQCPREYF